MVGVLTRRGTDERFGITLLEVLICVGHKLRDWLLRQRRGDRSWLNGPSSVPFISQVQYDFKRWKWWQLGAQLAVGLVIVFAFWTISRQRVR